MWRGGRKQLGFCGSNIANFTTKLWKMKNVTLSIPEDLLEKSREYAKERGTTLENLIQELLKRNVSDGEKNPIGKAIVEHARKMAKPVGYDWNREDAYEG